jgi:hypothetical protein
MFRDQPPGSLADKKGCSVAIGVLAILLLIMILLLVLGLMDGGDVIPPPPVWLQ